MYETEVILAYILEDEFILNICLEFIKKNVFYIYADELSARDIKEYFYSLHRRPGVSLSNVNWLKIVQNLIEEMEQRNDDQR